MTMDEMAVNTIAAEDALGIASGIVAAGSVIGGIVAVIMLISMWKLFSKAGAPGWKAIIPLYNTYTMFDLFWAGCNPLLMVILCCIPVVGAVVALILYYKMCKSFDKGIGFLILLLLFFPIMLPILAFGNSDYIGAQ